MLEMGNKSVQNAAGNNRLKHNSHLNNTTNMPLQRGITLSGYVGLHDFSRLVKPSHRNPLLMDKGRAMAEKMQ